MAANKARFEAAVLVQRLASQATIRGDNVFLLICAPLRERVNLVFMPVYLC